MTKNKVRGLLFPAIILIVFCVISFVVPFEKNAGFFVAFAFGVVAILFQLYVFKVAFDKEDAKSRFYGFPIVRLGVIYLVIQLIISIISMIVTTLIPVVPTWIFVIIDVIALALAILGCITAETMRDEIVSQDIKIKTDVANIRGLQSMSASMAAQCDSSAIKPTLQTLAEDFKYSDPVSSDATKDMEDDIEACMKDLQQAVIEGDDESVKTMCKSIQAKLAERNRVCKLNK